VKKKKSDIIWTQHVSTMEIIWSHIWTSDYLTWKVIGKRIHEKEHTKKCYPWDVQDNCSLKAAICMCTCDNLYFASFSLTVVWLAATRLKNRQVWLMNAGNMHANKIWVVSLDLLVVWLHRVCKLWRWHQRLLKSTLEQ